jgi:hypothetical protein
MPKQFSATPTFIPPGEDRLLTSSETGKFLGLTTETLKKYRKRESATKGPKFVRLNGRVVRYKLSDLLAYIAGSEVRQ